MLRGESKRSLKLSGKVSVGDAKHITIRNTAYVFHGDIIDYWDTVPGVIMDSLLSQILNIHASQTEIVDVDVEAAW